MYTSIGLCHACHSSGVKVTLTALEGRDGMVTQIPICEKCRK